MIGHVEIKSDIGVVEKKRSGVIVLPHRIL